MGSGICAICAKASVSLIEYGRVSMCPEHVPGPADDPDVGWCATGHWGVGQYRTKGGLTVCRECYFRPLRRYLGRTP